MLERDLFFLRAGSLAKEYASYSIARDAWTISAPHLELIFDDYLDDRPDGLSSLDAILKEGKHRGIWETDFDYEFITEIVIIR